MNLKPFRFLALMGATALSLSLSNPALSDPAKSDPAKDAPAAEKSAEQTAEAEPEKTVKQPPLERGAAGKYLSSHFAQSRHDWAAANDYLSYILAADPQNLELIRRSMILAIGSGDLTVASQRAHELTAIEKGDGLALMILAVNDMAAENMDSAIKHLDAMKAGDMTDFVKPILRGWAAAAQGKLDLDGFNETTIHRYHGGMLSAFLGKKDKVKEYADGLMAVGSLSNTDAERAADLLSYLGRYEEAAVLYEGVLAQNDDNKRLEEKLAEAKKKDGGAILQLIEPMKIKKAQQGAALAMYDMAYILYQEHSDSSTKLFAHMALALDPMMTEAHMLLADTLTRNDRLEEAIKQLANIPEGHESYLIVQRHAAELLAEVGRTEEAKEKLQQLFTKHNDVESLIRIGDLYRHNEDYKGALKAYNEAATHIGGEKIPEEYWYLLYARGMAYEREGDWKNAESDLKAALGYRPDHPYLLNYLGYGWADQGQNLDESLKLIKRAVSLQPNDGYIIDSLGWVQYMMKDYAGALPSLERAVELLPYDSTINDHLGDVYWQVGRRMEARFQWERARNYSEETVFKERLDQKLQFGLAGIEEIKQAGAVTTPPQ